jgi:hypothetical protein
MTAARFLSLYCQGGDDDMFSSDLTDDQLQVSDEASDYSSPSDTLIDETIVEQ